MAEYPVRERKVAPMHPGELLREILEEHLKLPLTEAAQRMQLSRPALYAVLNGKSRITPAFALRFAKLVGTARLRERPKRRTAWSTGMAERICGRMQQRLRRSRASLLPLH